MVPPTRKNDAGNVCRLYDFDRRWLLDEIASDYWAYRESMDPGAPDCVLIGRIDARLLVGLQFDLLSHQEEATLRTEYLAGSATDSDGADGAV